MDDEIPYFKIRYAFLRSWALKEAAYLLLGHDPEVSDFKIGNEHKNPVSLLAGELKANKEEFSVTDTSPRYTSDELKALEDKGTRKLYLSMKKRQRKNHYSVDQLFQYAIDHNVDFDREIYALRKLSSYKKPEKEKKDDPHVRSKIYKRLARTLYRKAAGIVTDKYGVFTNREMVKLLAPLSEELSSIFPVEFKETESSIMSYFRAHSAAKIGRPNSRNDEEIVIDWRYVLEKIRI